MGETPFRMAFSIEVILPIEIEIPSFWVQTFDEMVNKIGLRSELDGIEEVHEAMKKWVLAYQQRAAQCYDKKVRHMIFCLGDLVCQKLEAMGSQEVCGKMAPN